MASPSQEDKSGGGGGAWGEQERRPSKAWGILLFGLIGATTATFAVAQVRRSAEWFYTQLNKMKTTASWRNTSNSSSRGSFSEDARRRYYQRMQQEYEEEQERVQRIRHMQSVFNRERNKFRGSYESWRENDPPGGYNYTPRDDWYWQTDTSHSEHKNRRTYTPAGHRVYPMSHHYAVLGLDRSRATPYTDAEVKPREMSLLPSVTPAPVRISSPIPFHSPSLPRHKPPPIHLFVVARRRKHKGEGGELASGSKSQEISARMGKASSAVSCLCCPCKCLACGLFSCLCSILISLLVTVGVLALIFYLIFRPHVITATVDSASLAQFSLAPNSALSYNLTVALTVRNPNKRVGLYYDNVESLAYFEDQRFGYAQLDSFYQATEASTQVTPQFHGQQPLQDDANFRSQQSDGKFSVDVKLNAKLRVKVWAFKVPGPKTKISCPLSIPAPGSTSATFQPTTCKVWF